LRILYQHRTLGDGAEGIHIRELVEAFRRLGHEVELFGLAVDSPITDRRSSAVAGVRRVIPRGAFELAQFATSGATYIPLRRRIASFKPDFVYKRHAKYDFGTVIAARHSGVPLILEVNCVYAGPSLQDHEPASFPKMLARTERWIFEHADYTITVSTALKREVADIAPRARPVVMSNGVNHRLFVPNESQRLATRARLNVREGEVVVGFVGTLWKWHGLELLIDAFSQLPRSSDMHLLIVGDGEMRLPIESMCRERHLDDRVIFAGRVSHAEVAQYVAAMDITVLPAEHRTHASPMKVIEYMAAAKPVVAPRLANLQEIVTDGVDGLLFEPNSPASLGSCLTALASDEVLRVRLGRAARAKVERELNWDNNARKVIDLFHQITSPRSR
jgi:glycosyltransferase involved in cell wall biosynthesis